MILPALLGFVFLLGSHEKLYHAADRDSVSGGESILRESPHLAVAVIPEHHPRMIHEGRGHDPSLRGTVTI